MIIGSKVLTQNANALWLGQLLIDDDSLCCEHLTSDFIIYFTTHLSIYVHLKSDFSDSYESFYLKNHTLNGPT